MASDKGEKVFNVAVFFVVFRECLEAVLVVSVLLSFLKQAVGADADPTIYKRLRKQVWIGVASGVTLCLIIGGGFIGAFYGLKKDIYGKADDLWEGIFCLLASIMISFMGIAMLRINKMQAKWRIKIAKALTEVPERRRDRFRIGYLMKKYCMFILPFVTCLREGLEAVVFVAGAGVTTVGAKAESFPLPVVVGLICGLAVGFFIFYGGSRSSLQVFLVISTCILYLISAGLFSRAAWGFENYRFNLQTGGDASEGGDGNGSYNIHKAVYHVNCCNPERDNGWDVFNSLLGWQNTGYLSSILCYNLYWVGLIIVLSLMMYEERHGHLPFCKGLKLRELNPMYHIKGKKKQELTEEQKKELFRKLENVNFDKEGNVQQREVTKVITDETE